MIFFINLILWSLSIIYRSAIFVWDKYWRLCPKVKLNGKVISVGNITAGGTGKTPIVILLANRAARKNLNVAIVARGYKRINKGLAEVTEKSLWQEVGDEPLEIFRRTDRVRVYLDKSKTIAARKAARDGAELIIIDDGFQHRKLHRDIDIVCLDWSKPLGPGGMLPLGHLREPGRALKRADIIVHTSYDPDIMPDRKLNKGISGVRHFYSKSAISGFVDIKSGATKSIEELKGTSLIAFCGIGNPIRFRKALANIGLIPVEFVILKDHLRYSQNDIDKLISQAGTLDADYLVCTYKDGVKIRDFDFGEYAVYSAELKIDITDETGVDRLEELIRILDK